MYIKRITIQGFKTYKNTTIIDDLSPHYNVILGRNGSGKSNFFAAVRFVLSDAYTNMTREERQGLIHEGLGTVMLAFVEVVFDNSDGRFPLNRDEVAIRRTVGLKKDDYSLDGKLVTFSDIMNLLELAGFSRSNPYYIVPQGRITALTNSHDGDRFKLLKEVSGASVFERKLKELMKEMNNNDYKVEQIDEALAAIKERLGDLEIELEDLQNFHNLEKQRKIYEYNLYERELQGLHQQIASLDDGYRQVLQLLNQDLADLELREQLCQDLTESIARLKTQLAVSKLEREQIKSEYDNMLEHVTAKRVQVEELRDVVSFQEEGLTLSKEIADINGQIDEKRHQLATVNPKLAQLRAQEADLKEKLMMATSLQRGLYSKQNRFKKYKSKQQRDAKLSEEITRYQTDVSAQERAFSKISSEVDALTTQVEEMRGEIMNLEADLHDAGNLKQAQITATIKETRNQIEKLIDERKRLWRQEIKLKSLCDSVSQEMNKASQLVNKTMPRQQAIGLAAVRKLVTDLDLGDKVYGTVAEIFSVSDKYKIATEVVLGNALFHVVVDSDVTAALLMEKIARTNSGRVTFIPLNRIPAPPAFKYPDASHKCFPLISKLKYENKFGGVMAQLCGRVLVCADLEIAGELAKAYKMIGITIDGDRADTRGVISGGYIDHRKSRMDALKLQRKKKEELDGGTAKLAEVVQQIDEILSELTGLHNQVQLASRDLEKWHQDKQPKQQELAHLQLQIEDLEDQLADARGQQATVALSRATLLAAIGQLEAELASDFVRTLLAEETSQLESLTHEVAELEGDLDDVVGKCNETETEVLNIQSQLKTILEPKLNKIKQREIAASTGESLPAMLAELERELEVLEIKMDGAQALVEALDTEIAKITKEIAVSETNLAKLNELQLAMVFQVEEQSKQLEATLNKKAVMEQRQDELNHKVRELGVLPEEAFNTDVCEKMLTSEMLSELKGIHENLGQYSHINKKAMEQYHSFNKQSEELKVRREELGTAKHLIEQLVANLNRQKYQTINKSFETVAKLFNEIFAKLVPRGVGHLKLVKVNEENETKENEDSDVDMSDGENNVEEYLGVSIVVSFNSQKDEQQRIEQLLGGQKSLCAIALIFAIQAADPAPFYLLDEIDANLDQQYRQLVAAMIKKLSKNAQFICTTFRPEMIQVADRFYGVMYANKVSTIEEVGQAEALSFVEV